MTKCRPKWNADPKIPMNPDGTTNWKQSVNKSVIKTNSNYNYRQIQLKKIKSLQKTIKSHNKYFIT